MKIKITKERVNELLLNNRYKFAKTMASFPHDYTLRETWTIDSEFVDVVLFIRKYGNREKWGSKYFTYYYANGYKYWTMGNPVCYNDNRKTFVINRVKAEEPEIKTIKKTSLDEFFGF